MSLQAICFSAAIDWSTMAGREDVTIEKTLNRARRVNRVNGVTGAVLLYPNSLVQWLEGPAAGLASSLECARAETRLSDITIISEGPVETRMFAESWLMFADLRAANARPSAFLETLANATSPVPCAQMRTELQAISKRLEPARHTHAAMLV